jgi:hypothetical protein
MVDSSSYILLKSGVLEWVSKRDRQCTYKHNTEARSCNHCCRGKAISIIQGVS